MSLQFGLNVKKAKPADEAPTRRGKRAVVFDDDDALEASDDEGVRAEEEVAEVGVGGISFSSKPSFSSKSSGSGLSKPKPKPSNKPRLGSGAPPTRKPKPLTLDDTDNVTGPDFGDMSSMRDTAAIASTAQSLDPTIYDYDAFHDAHSLVSQQRKAVEKEDAVTRKPKYINNLLDAAARRKQDQLVAREKLLQKEREAEGDEFADKEKFVTDAYKAQQEETRRLEEEEKRNKDEEEERRRKTGGGMQGFYRNLMGQEDKRHQEAMEAAAKLEKGQVPTAAVDADGKDDMTKTEAQLAAEMRAKGVNIHINEEGQITDKRQLLSAGLNVAPAVGGSGPSASDHLKTANQKGRENAYQAGGRYDRNDQRSMRERQTRMLEQQLEESNKRKREEEDEERKRLEEKSKSRKTEGDISSARERYLARKREQEEAKKKAAAGG